jgi:hypothetical protein
MCGQITHKVGEDGYYKQIVTPKTLRKILDQQGSDYKRPVDFTDKDEWDWAVAEMEDSNE